LRESQIFFFKEDKKKNEKKYEVNVFSWSNENIKRKKKNLIKGRDNTFRKHTALQWFL